MRLNKTALSIWMVVFVLSFTAGAFADDFSNLPVKGMATMIDLGAKKCIPCKMMAPIMEKMEKAYKGKAHIIFIDVWENRDQAKRFNLRAIPTQIFFNEQGEEVYRHVGFLDENSIVEQLTKMGVAAPELINKG
ncbi:MAG: thioredoxin family protein [Proteobacteria bacterium]|nr:thioredoxin family protein [Pseudomonadota bacterium]MBU1583649.1 thioredoxin family protein [Pseudomonadota bacterium]MBU2454687.1 thioredoxin family protein [Pseudomonadota bacterium]MBU2628143.1 thioredoxin family protein [Pseudomonadota bacterium]